MFFSLVMQTGLKLGQLTGDGELSSTWYEEHAWTSQCWSSWTWWIAQQSWPRPSESISMLFCLVAVSIEWSLCFCALLTPKTVCAHRQLVSRCDTYYLWRHFYASMFLPDGMCGETPTHGMQFLWLVLLVSEACLDEISVRSPQKPWSNIVGKKIQDHNIQNNISCNFEESLSCLYRLDNQILASPSSLKDLLPPGSMKI